MATEDDSDVENLITGLQRLSTGNYDASIDKNTIAIFSRTTNTTTTVTTAQELMVVVRAEPGAWFNLIHYFSAESNQLQGDVARLRRSRDSYRTALRSDSPH